MKEVARHRCRLPAFHASCPFHPPFFHLADFGPPDKNAFTSARRYLDVAQECTGTLYFPAPLKPEAPGCTATIVVAHCLSLAIRPYLIR